MSKIADRLIHFSPEMSYLRLAKAYLVNALKKSSVDVSRIPTELRKLISPSVLLRCRLFCTTHDPLFLVFGRSSVEPTGKSATKVLSRNLVRSDSGSFRCSKRPWSSRLLSFLLIQVLGKVSEHETVGIFSTSGA